MSGTATPSHTTTTTTHDNNANLLPRAVALLRAGEDAPSRPTSGHGPYTAGGWNTVASSARTSYTRVDLAGIVDEMDSSSPPPPLPLPVSDTHEELGEEQEEDRVVLCFLCVSGGRKTMSFGPETAVGRVKELLLNAWPEDWTEERPPGATYLRILHQGKILQDDDTLLKLKFPISRIPASLPPNTTSTIVHLSIRPVAPKGGENGEDDTLKKRGVLGRLMSTNSVSPATGEEENANGGRAGCCGCVIS